MGASPENDISGKQRRKDMVLLQLLVSSLSAAAGKQLTGGREEISLSLKGWCVRFPCRARADKRAANTAVCSSPQ